MFKFNGNAESEKFDGIILSYGKGKVIWAPAAEAKDFDTMRDFNNFSVVPIRICQAEPRDHARNAGRFFHVLKRRQRNIDSTQMAEGSHNSLFGIATEKGSDKFWLNDNKAFTFVTLVQFGQGFTKMSESLKLLKDYLKKNADSDLAYFIYYSLEISDFIVFMKTDELQKGREFIFKFRRNFKPSFYSYTKFGFDKSAATTDTMDVNKLAVCFPIESPGKYKEWASALKTKWAAYNPEIRDRLGHEDISINVRNIPAKSVIEEIDTGLLADEEFDKENKKGYVGAISRPRIIFDSDFDGNFNKCGLDYVLRNVNQEADTICKRYTRDCKNIPMLQFPPYENGTHEERVLLHVQKALVNMFKAVGMLEGKHFARDIVACAKATYDTFIEDVKEELYLIAGKKTEGEVSSANYMTLQGGLHSYINANMSLIQGGLQADTVFFQAPGFHISLYEAPTKLVVFYQAFVKKLQNALEGNNRMDVVFNIGLHTHASVRKIFDADNKQDLNRHTLLEIKIPMNMLFVPHRLIPQLSHELAHFCKLKFRHRPLRNGLIITEFVKQLAEIVLSPIDNCKLGSIDTQKKVLSYLMPEGSITQQNCLNIVTEYAKKYFDSPGPRPTQLGGIKELVLTELEMHMVDALHNFFSPQVVEEMLEKLLDTIHYTNKPIQSNMEIYEGSLNAFVQIIYSTTAKMNKGNHMISEIISLMKEAFADFVMITSCGEKWLDKSLYLKTVFEEINTFFRTPADYELEHFLRKNCNLQRVCSVVELMYGADFNNVLNGVEFDYPDAKNTLQTAMTKVRGENEHAFASLTKCVKFYLSICKNELEKQSSSDRFKDTQEIFWAIANENVTMDEFIEIFYKVYDEFVVPLSVTSP